MLSRRNHRRPTAAICRHLKSTLWLLTYSLFTLSALHAQTDTTRLSNKLRHRATLTDTTTAPLPPPTKPNTPRPSTPRPHSVPLAVGLSAILPGAGQIYNGSWWKAPIVWASIGGLTYITIQEGRQFARYRRAYQYRFDADTSTRDDLIGIESNAELTLNRNRAQRQFELAVVALSATYALNLVDAFVDAHLHDFDVSDRLSLRLSPSFNLRHHFTYRDVRYQPVATLQRAVHTIIPGFSISLHNKTHPTPRPRSLW